MNSANPIKTQTCFALSMIAGLIILACIVSGALIWFSLPDERVISAGHLEDYDWREPEYVPLESDLAVFLDREGEAVTALSAVSTTSGCKIAWIDDLARFRDPCCGSSWTRGGIPSFGPAIESGPLPHYSVQVTQEGEILVRPWREGPGGETGSC